MIKLIFLVLFLLLGIAASAQNKVKKETGDVRITFIDSSATTLQGLRNELKRTRPKRVETWTLDRSDTVPGVLKTVDKNGTESAASKRAFAITEKQYALADSANTVVIRRRDEIVHFLIAGKKVPLTKSVVFTPY